MVTHILGIYVAIQIFQLFISKSLKLAYTSECLLPAERWTTTHHSLLYDAVQ